MAEEEKNTASSKLTVFLEKNRKAVWTILIVIVVALVGFIVIDSCNSKNAAKGIAAIDEISYAMTNESSTLEDDELDARRNEAMEKLAPYANKSGIIGLRANMLCAEIAYQQEKYEDAVNYWNATISKGKKSYTAPLAYFNIAACYEELNNLDAAAENYKMAADNESFAIKNHAKFSYGRVLEAKNDFAGAVAAYTELFDSNPDDTWAKIAKTRIIYLQSQGKAE